MQTLERPSINSEICAIKSFYFVVHKLFYYGGYKELSIDYTFSSHEEALKFIRIDKEFSGNRYIYTK